MNIKFKKVLFYLLLKFEQIFKRRFYIKIMYNKILYRSGFPQREISEVITKGRKGRVLKFWEIIEFLIFSLLFVNFRSKFDPEVKLKHRFLREKVRISKTAKNLINV